MSFYSTAWNPAVLQVDLMFWLQKWSFQQRIHHAKFQLNLMKNGWVMTDQMRFCSAAWNTAMLQGPSFASSIDPFHLEDNHAKFQLNLLRNGWDIGCTLFRDSAVLHGILQGHCLDSRLHPNHIGSHHAKFQLNPLRNGRDIDCLEFRWGGVGWWGGWVLTHYRVQAQA